MTIQEAAERTLAIQDACNLSGLVFAFPDVMRAVCEEGQRTGQGTAWKNTHPIVRCYLDKLCDLARMERDTPTENFYACSDIARGTS